MKLLMTAVLILCLALGGCASNQVLATLQASVAATEALLVTLQIAGKIQPATANAIENALINLPEAYSQTAAELATTEDAAMKAVKISGYFATTIYQLNMLPPDARVYASAITAAINAFLNSLSVGQQALKAGKPGASTSPALDAKSLQEIALRAAKMDLKLKALEAK